MWVDKAAQNPHMLHPRIQIKANNLDVEAQLADFDPESLTSLELDWNFDGRLFRSEAQSVRGWRQDQIKTRLDHSYSEAGSYVVAARAVDAEGKTGIATERVEVA